MCWQKRLEKILHADIDGIVTVVASGKVVAPLTDRSKVEGRGEQFDIITAFGQNLTFRINDEGASGKVEMWIRTHSINADDVGLVLDSPCL